LTIAPNASLTVNGNLINGATSQNLIINSDASLIHYTSGVEATVKRSVAAAEWSDWQDGWHFLSSPVETQLIDSAGGFITSGSGNDFDFYTWSEADNLWVNFKNTLAPPIFTTINPGNYFNPAKGYMVAYQQGGEKQFQGILQNADIQVQNLTLTGSEFSGGWHLLGNPYPCALSWYTGWNTVNIGGVAQIWNEAARSYTPVNQGEMIPACNGFMVQVTGSPGSTGSLVIPAANRSHSSLSWYKETGYPVIKLLVRNLEEPGYQECQLRFNPLSSNDIDAEYDGVFLAGFAPSLFTVCNQVPLAVNSLPTLENGMSVPLNFRKNSGSLFRMEATFNGQFPAMVMVFDKKTGELHNLATEPQFDFNAGDADPPERFLLTFSHVGTEENHQATTTLFCVNNELIISGFERGTLEIFSLAGVRMLNTKLETPGIKRVAINEVSGWYIARLTSGNEVIVRKIWITGGKS